MLGPFKKDYLNMPIARGTRVKTEYIGIKMEGVLDEYDYAKSWYIINIDSKWHGHAKTLAKYRHEFTII